MTTPAVLLHELDNAIADADHAARGKGEASEAGRALRRALSAMRGARDLVRALGEAPYPSTAIAPPVALDHLAYIEELDRQFKELLGIRDLVVETRDAVLGLPAIVPPIVIDEATAARLLPEPSTDVPGATTPATPAPPADPQV